MYTLHFCKLIDKHKGIYDEKIEKSNLDHFINKYSLINHGETCEYWINNVEIIKNKDKETFNYINDINVNFKNGKIIREYAIKECIPFLFSDVDCREEYNLYIGSYDNIEVLVKDFLEYLTIEFVSDNLDTLNNITLLNK